MNSISEDYYALRSEGINLLQKLSGQNWTDYNVHDPGITILEQLCYALTDLAYRIGHPIPDLLADPQGKSFAPELYRARAIMSSAPVTLDDYRKLLLDIRGVRNAWVEKATLPEPLFIQTDLGLRLFNIGEKDRDKNPITGIPLKGLLTVKIEPETNEAINGELLLQEVTARMMELRNLCGDFIHVELLQAQPLSVKADIEVDEIVDPTELLTEIYMRLDRFVLPRARFYSLEEMIEKGYQADELMEGPSLASGYLDPAEFNEITRKEFLRGSDLIKVISDIPGVRFVRTLEMILYDKEGKETQRDPWSVRLDPSQFTKLIIPDGTYFEIKLKRGAFTLDTPGFQNSWQLRITELLTSSTNKNDLDIVPVAGRYRAQGAYQSIQNDFPLMYGIGEGGLTDDAPNDLKGRVKQLKAYLLFFDQILANSFAQLDGFRTIISFNNPENKSRFSQLPVDVPSLESILIYDLEEQEIILQRLNETPSGSGENKQLHRVADHLLARVGEQISDYGLLRKAGNSKHPFLELKKRLLQQYPQLSQYRATGINYAAQADENISLSALHKRISILLDIPDAPAGDERFWLVENILLRPLHADIAQYHRNELPGNRNEPLTPFYSGKTAANDIFSLQVCFIFPGWIDRFNQTNFRSYAEGLIRNQTPAHIAIYIYWMEEAAFNYFETAIKVWQLQLGLNGKLLASSESTGDSMLKVRLARNSVVDCLAAAGSVFGFTYPVLDLPVQGPGRVMEGDVVQITIALSQQGVSYRIWDRTKQSFSGNAETGTGGTIKLTSDPQKIDNNTVALVPVLFDIQAVSLKSDYQEFWLQTMIEVTVTQLELNLDIQIIQNDKILEKGEIAYDSAFSVRIIKPQKGVEYTIYSALLEDGDFEYNAHGKDLTYSINFKRFLSDDNLFTASKSLKAITNDAGEQAVDINVPGNKKMFKGDSAIRLGAAFKAENRENEFLDEMVYVFMSPDPKVEATLLTDPRQVQIANPEKGVLYSLYNNDERMSSCAWIPDKTLADTQNNANKNLRIEVDFVPDALNGQAQLPLKFLVPPEVQPDNLSMKAQKLNTKLEATLKLEPLKGNPEA